MSNLTTWYIEAKNPLPSGILQIFERYSTTPVVTASNSMSFITFDIPEEAVPETATKIRDLLEQNNLSLYVIRTEKFIAADECYDIESEGWYEDSIAQIPSSDNNPAPAPVLACNFALQVTETHHHGYAEDESARSEINRKIVLLPADDEIIAEYEASMFEDQDYSYQVNVKRIGILDMPGEKLACDDTSPEPVVIVRQYPEASLDELQKRAECYDSNKPIILTTGPVVIKNLRA